MSVIPWWTPGFPDLIASRGAMPTVKNWQTCYARYRGESEAHFASTGWELSACHRAYQQQAMTSNAVLLPETHPVFSDAAPTAISLNIVEAPAEFSVPVKQDRRLTPNFKVRVDVKYRQRVSCPLTVKAYILTQQEKDSILHWCPDDTIYELDGVQKTMTDLKGTTSITSHFEATAPLKAVGDAAALLQGAYASSNGAAWSQVVDGADVEQLVLANSAGLSQLQAFNAGSSRGLSLGQPGVLVGLNGRQIMDAGDNVVSQEIEFTNLEFVKPSRMNKVYIAFACSVLDQDLLFVLYNVPTVCICRAEQRSKACRKLGICMEELNKLDSSIYNAPAVGSDRNEDFRKRARAGAPVEPDTPSGSQQNYVLSPKEVTSYRPAQPSLALPNDSRTNMECGGQDVTQQTQGAVKDEPFTSNSLTQAHIRQWITEVYESTGLSRKLTQLDVQALLSHAGFPADSLNEHTCISTAQCREFTQQYMAVLSLLRVVAPIWDLEDPCVISGFDMDRIGTVQALAREPAGTFIIRFSMSQPGCLVLSCKVTQGHPNADEHGLIHAILDSKDLQERRVDTWIRDFVGATHVLDVYRQKRVDKRKVFASHYTKPRVLEAINEIVPVDVSTAISLAALGTNSGAFATLAQSLRQQQQRPF